MDYNSIAWLLAVLSGFGAKVAYEITEKVRKNEVNGAYWLQTLCSGLITVVVGYHSHSYIERKFNSTDLKSAVYALMGIGAFTMFKTIYKVVTNAKFWDGLVKYFLNRGKLPNSGGEEQAEDTKKIQ